MKINKKCFLCTLISIFLIMPLNVKGICNKPTEGTPEKIAFLTFDDGPTPNNTVKIINELNKSNIKATFFVVGQKEEENPIAFKELVKNKMCIMPHTYSHNYDIYKSLSTYNDDLDKCMNLIRGVRGKKKLEFVRIPGGSDNQVSNKYVLSSIRKSILDRGMNYVDWNVCSGDAEAHYVPKSKIIGNVKKQCTGQKIIVILMHDSYYKKTTVESLSEIINYIKDKGYTFKTFDDVSEKEKNEMIDMGIINRKQKIDEGK